MSGGQLDYIYHNVDDVADRLNQSKNAYHKAFGQHLKLVAKALHDVEWVLSGDCSDGDDIDAINACITHQSFTEAAIEKIKEMMEQLQILLEAYERTRT